MREALRYLNNAREILKSVFAINWTAGGNTTTYIYDFVEDAVGTAVVATELTLVGVVTHAATSILAAGDLP